LGWVLAQVRIWSAWSRAFACLFRSGFGRRLLGFHGAYGTRGRGLDLASAWPEIDSQDTIGGSESVELLWFARSSCSGWCHVGLWRHDQRSRVGQRVGWYVLVMMVQCLMLINNSALIVSGFSPSRRDFVLLRCILYSRVMFINGPSLMKLIHDRHWLHFLPASASVACICVWCNFSVGTWSSRWR